MAKKEGGKKVEALFLMDYRSGEVQADCCDVVLIDADLAKELEAAGTVDLCADAINAHK